MIILNKYDTTPIDIHRMRKAKLKTYLEQANNDLIRANQNFEESKRQLKLYAQRELFVAQNFFEDIHKRYSKECSVKNMISVWVKTFVKNLKRRK